MRADLYRDLYVMEDHHWWHKAKRNLIAMLMPAQANNPTILDVGCGTGKNIEALSGMGTVFGIDISDEAIQFCRKRGLTNVQRGDVLDIPHKHDSVDVAIALDVIEHVDDRRAVDELFRVIKPNGTLIITVPAFSWLWSEWDKALHHKRRYSKQSLTQTLTNSGFVVAKCSYVYSFLLVPVFFIRKIKELIKRGDREYESDFQINNPLLNSALYRLALLEQWVIKRYDIPFGTSLICVAKKQNPSS